jgi:hypothetical protein
MNSPKKPRDIIHSLRKPNSTHFANHSDEMAEIAQLHHENLQKGNLPHEIEDIRHTTRQRYMREVPNTQKTENHNSLLHSMLQEKHTHEALFSSKSGSAAGTDGIPYEVWKKLHEKHIDNQKKECPSFNIIRTLTLVFNDIQIHDIDPDSKFTLGWMCPIFKKQERTEIVNYHPITLLNTDYKILTKALAMQLA